MAARCRGYLAGLQSWVSPRTRQTLLGGEPFGSFRARVRRARRRRRRGPTRVEADPKINTRLGVQIRIAELEVVEADGVRALLNIRGAADGAEQRSASTAARPPLGTLGSAVGGLGLVRPLCFGPGALSRSRTCC